jgi:hypothetical protein
MGLEESYERHVVSVNPEIEREGVASAKSPLPFPPVRSLYLHHVHRSQLADASSSVPRWLLVFVAVVMVTTGQEIIENKIAHIITQSLASILIEAEMLTG